ncbi:helix-turn-helix domain-containing protein [Streptomyces sp. NPDC005500]|uniref:helix-turn-helix domain-containing protein n=1 Tax=Streptomyces sp. NPDC005500 TaxID=3155007 RepID=UPI0033AF0D27
MPAGHDLGQHEGRRRRRRGRRQDAGPPGRPAALDEDKAADVVDAYAKGAAVRALAGQYDVAPKTIRRVLDAAGARDVLEEPDCVAAGVEDQEQSHAIDVPGLLAEHLKDTDVAAIQETLRSGRTIRPGQGYSVRVTAPLALHQTTLMQCAALASDESGPAVRKAYCTYADRIAAATLMS